MYHNKYKKRRRTNKFENVDDLKIIALLTHPKRKQVLVSMLRSLSFPKGLMYLGFMTIFGIAVFTSVYTRAYEVTLDGKIIALVENSKVLETAINEMEQQATQMLGEKYNLGKSLDGNARFVKRDQLVSSDQLATVLINQLDEVKQSYVLKIDGEVIAANSDQTAIEAVLQDLKLQYVSEATIDTDFVQKVEIAYDYIATDFEKDVELIRDTLSSNTLEAVTYTVVKGDTYSEITKEHDMKLSELMALNPQASLDRLMIGDILNVKKEVPYLSVKTVDEISYTETVESPVEYVEDASLYVGDTKVITEGTAGLANVKARVTMLNGFEEKREIIKNTLVLKPVTKVIAKGTAPRPKTASNGIYIWPLSGTVTSTTGKRYLFGTTNYHSGLDIAAPYGTTVKASDGGEVTFSGWRGDYGNLVIITHDNGTQTYYAHNSSLLVSKGDKVYQGQSIAKVGSTGRTTGNHSHFEVRVGGSIKNPYNYLA